MTGERYIKLNALKRIVWDTANLKIEDVDHKEDSLWVLISDSKKQDCFVMEFPDTDKPTEANAETYIKGKLY